MTTEILKLELPESLSPAEARLLLAIKLFEVGKVSLNQAAKLADYSKRGFIEILAHHRVPAFNYSAKDLRQELADTI
jgi:predicted HTH domain antitoxin